MGKQGSPVSLLALACSLAACGGSSPAGNTQLDGGPDSDIVTCQNDPRVAAYAANLTLSSLSGAYRIILDQADPAPPAIGINTWTIKVEDSSGAPMANPALNVLPFMPDHGHGTSVKAGITTQADGTLSVTPLYLFMGGVWRVEFNPQSAPDPIDFFFCIAG